MSDLSHRVTALEEGLSSASKVRLSVAQLGAFIAAIACATWWVSSHMASKEDVKGLEEKAAATAVSLKEVSTMVAVLKDRSDRFEIPMVSSPVAEIAVEPPRTAVMPHGPFRAPAAPTATSSVNR